MRVVLKSVSYVLILIVAFCFVTTTAYAKVSDNAVVIMDPSNGGDSEISEDCNGVLGSVSDDNSVAHLLQEAFKLMKFAAPVLVFAFSVIDFLKAVSSQDKDQLQKAIKRTIIRIIVGLIVFVVPSICNFVFDLLGWYGTCGIK